MIPVKLSLHNFMCYKEVAPISFEGIHTACISGNNGNGKSALIDAITWALWGETRASSDDDLIHTGQFEAQVDYEFEVDKSHYRVIRKRTRAKTQKTPGKTVLELQVLTTSGFRPLTGDSVGQTENKIKNILHMDYQTFVNSAFLRQGHANEFSTKRPSERKQVLANVLQLSLYEELKEDAKESAKKLEIAVSQIEVELNALQSELRQKPLYQAELENAQKEHSTVETSIIQTKKRLDALVKEKSDLENYKVQLAALVLNIKEAQQNLSRWQEQARQHEVNIETYQELINQRTTIEDNFQHLVEVHKEARSIEQKAKQFRNLEQSKNRLEMLVLRANDLLKNEHTTTMDRIEELETTCAKIPQLRKDLQQIAEQLKVWEDAESRLRQKREAGKEIQARKLFLQSEDIRLAGELTEIEDRLQLLSQGKGYICPLCETELGADGQQRIRLKYESNKSALVEAIDSNRKEFSIKESETRTIELEIVQLENKIKLGKSAAQSRLGNLGKALSDAEEAQEKTSEQKIRLSEIEQKLVSREFARNEQVGLKEIEKQIADLDYNPGLHDRITTKLGEMEGYETPKHKLEEALKLILQEQESEARARTTAGEISTKIEKETSLQQILLSQIEASDRIITDLPVCEKEYQEMVSKQHHFLGLIGGAKARLERLNELEISQKEKQKQLSEKAGEEKIYRDLAQAFGRDGVQAMLIEMAIPEIENEANKLLSMMTDGRMHVKLEPQKETQKGDLVETLELNITDELGTRNYEMFSGGEAFRIDFAVRIALSRLLAHRAGAPLSTLIIDEGFGTQDSNGIEKIKEAITSIQDSFEKILVITHISDFKDAFPVRFEVIKTAEGSTVLLS
jgi:DNA repair protein SbcC/Rad50